MFYEDNKKLVSRREHVIIAEEESILLQEEEESLDVELSLRDDLLDDKNFLMDCKEGKRVEYFKN